MPLTIKKNKTMIKRSAAMKMAESQEKMQAYVTMTEFHYAQICIKHEPASLIPIGIDYEGEVKKLEEMADIYFPEGEDDYDIIYILPKENLYLGPIAEGIITVHPEFKIDIFSHCDEGNTDDEQNKEQMGSGFAHKEDPEEVFTKNEDELEDDVKYYYIRLTMPPVNKKRRDFCHEQVKQIFNYTKVKLDKEKVVMKANVAPKTIGYTDKELDEVNKAMDKIYDDCLKQAEDMRNDKDDEIEMAYNKFVEMYGEDESDSVSINDTSASQPVQEETTPAEGDSLSTSLFGSASQSDGEGNDDEASQSMKL